MKTAPVLQVFACLLLLTLTGPPCPAEFYEYVDENGVRTFTDDKARIPSGRAPDARTHKEKYDHLNETERLERIRAEDARIDQMNQKVRNELETIRLREQAEQQRQRLAEEQKRRAVLKTPVTITANQVLVPVTFEKGSRQVTATLLLDTGASMTTMDQSLARALGISGGQESAAIVAGGGIVRTRTVTLDRVRVGPKAALKQPVMILAETGPKRRFQGLLGQDFLGRFTYLIDYKNRIIQWAE